MLAYTIGHSKHKVDEFIELLKNHNVNCICDIRSMPYSRFAGQFNREKIKEDLEHNGIKYLYFGEEFGGRRLEKELLMDGLVDFEKVAGNEKFLSGIERIKSGIQRGYTIALMCTEKNPMECHRSILVSRNLERNGISIQHILADGSLEAHRELEEKLIHKYFKDRKQISLDELFDEGTDYLNEAYKMANKEIGYRVQEK
jgi:uncharacterized protein (DUF488 family)